MSGSNIELCDGEQLMSDAEERAGSSRSTFDSAKPTDSESGSLSRIGQESVSERVWP